MNRCFSRKLKDNSGVSILFALLLFLVVSLVSITIIVASTSSVKRTNSSKKTEQYNLAVESALLMLKDDLDGKEYSYSINKDGSINSRSGNASIFNNELKDISYNIVSNNLSYNKTFTIEADNLNNVVVSTTINNNDGTYVITFKLDCVDDSNNILSSAYEKFNLTNNGKDKVEWKYYMSNSKEF